jgi:hypothetical protein
LLDLHYGSGSAYGYNAHDSVCISETVCADDFSLMVVGDQSGLGGLAASGIVGLSPKHGSKRGDLFIEKLKKTGAIDEAVFSLMINMKDDNSKVTFGGYDLQKFALPGQ